MKQLECSTCDNWNGAYNDDGRCVTCGGVVTEIEPFTVGREWAKQIEEVGDE